MKSDVKDLKLAPKGKLRIEWAGSQMKVLELIKERFAKDLMDEFKRDFQSEYILLQNLLKR